MNIELLLNHWLGGMMETCSVCPLGCNQSPHGFALDVAGVCLDLAFQGVAWVHYLTSLRPVRRKGHPPQPVAVKDGAMHVPGSGLTRLEVLPTSLRHGIEPTTRGVCASCRAPRQNADVRHRDASMTFRERPPPFVLSRLRGLDGGRRARLLI